MTVLTADREGDFAVIGLVCLRNDVISGAKGLPENNTLI
jgi:hypothetical protein